MATSFVGLLDKIRSPFAGENVYKDECVFSYDTPESENGLYVCMNTFLGFGRKYVELHHRKSGCRVFLHLKRTKKLIKESEKDDESPKKITRLAIGLEGGFDADSGNKYEYQDCNSVVVLPEFQVFSLSDDSLPKEVQSSAMCILAADSASKVAEVAAMEGTWDGEKRFISKHANTLLQLDNGVKVLPSGWKCAYCDLTSNLWLNLTDGTILCGRRYFDGTGGNNHAVEHYQKTKFPLAVKLGTITASSADVYSYDEDDMVEDPHLAEHLAHFGINIAQMEKTDKTMIELEVALNQKVGEWATIQETGATLVPLYGPGYTGMVNLGNSCYMNSVMQTLFVVPDFINRYVAPANQIFNSAPVNPTQDFNVQLTKLGYGLASGDYSKPPPENDSGEEPVQVGIRASQFKLLIGKGHPEFSTKRQQDAQEFFLHILNMVERNNRNTTNPCEAFKFEVEERIQCVQSGKVKYTYRSEYLLPLPIPLECATNKQAVSEYEKKKASAEVKGETLPADAVVRAHVPHEACIQAAAAPATVEDFYSTALNAKSVALKTTRMASFPDYLMIQLKKFAIGADWIPKKLDVEVDMPTMLDLSMFKGSGKQPGEEELPEEAPSVQEPSININEAIVSQLAEMGFPIEACKKAVYQTSNQGVEAAMQWVMEHMDDPDFAQPLQLPKQNKPTDFTPNEEAASMIMSMGFTKEQAVKALKATDNNIERAADWIFSHSSELDDDAPSSGAPPREHYRTGSGKYQLCAFVSHMGTSTLCGHYVCHILKNGKWVIYNDEKVAASEKPPKAFGYLYMYKRI